MRLARVVRIQWSIKLAGENVNHIVGSTTYSIVLYHRNGNRDKSQWTISQTSEVQAFTHALNSNWISGESAWGVFPVVTSPTHLGLAVDRETQLVIAKFVFNENQNYWHGYPANHIENEKDIPDESVLSKWIENSVLPVAKISKIGKGKKCNL